MNIFEFIIETIKYINTGFWPFITTLLLLGTVGVLLTAMIGAAAKFRLFNLYKGNNDKELLKNITNNQSNPQQNTIYDMLADAYDRYKKRDNKANDTDEEK